MGIVILTTPGDSRREFANSLYEMTLGKVDLVIIQKPKTRTRLEGLKLLYHRFKFKRFIKEIYYSILLRLDVRAKRALLYFQGRSGMGRHETHYLPKTMEVDSINSLDVLEVLKELNPDLLVIWGSGIVKPSIIKTAKKAINLHMGLCPYYRGALANQNAILHRNIRRVGATIHYAEEKVDTGDIVSIIYADISKPPKELLKELNDKAEKAYLETVIKLYAGEELERTKQVKSRSKNLLLKDWLPSRRYKLAQLIKKWEKSELLN